MTIYRGVREDGDGEYGHWWTTDEDCAWQFGDRVITREAPLRIWTVRPGAVKWLGELDSLNHDRLITILEAIADAKRVDAVLLPHWDYEADAVWIA